MQVIRNDLDCVDAIITAMDKLRFDVNGRECMQLAAHLTNFGNLRMRIADAVKAAEDDQTAKIKSALALAETRAPGKVEDAPLVTGATVTGVTKKKGKMG